MTVTPLTREIGTAERSLRALLERQLHGAGLTFPEWTVLTVLEAGGALTAGQLIESQLHGQVVPDASAADATVERLRASGLVGPADDAPDAPDGPDGPGSASSAGPGGDGPRFATTAAGAAVYRPVRAAVDRLTGEIFGDLPPADVDATRRTLVEVGRRAAALLAADPDT
jgi:hypothetical protein